MYQCTVYSIQLDTNNFAKAGWFYVCSIIYRIIAVLSNSVTNQNIIHIDNNSGVGFVIKKLYMS